MADKSIAKSIRITPEVFELVNGLPGEGFNQKFENMVLKYFKEEKALTARLESLQKNYDTTRRDFEKAQSIIQSLDAIKAKLFWVTEAAKFIPAESPPKGKAV